MSHDRWFVLAADDSAFPRVYMHRRGEVARPYPCSCGFPIPGCLALSSLGPARPDVIHQAQVVSHRKQLLALHCDDLVQRHCTVPSDAASCPDSAVARADYTPISGDPYSKSSECRVNTAANASSVACASGRHCAQCSLPNPMCHLVKSYPFEIDCNFR